MLAARQTPEIAATTTDTRPQLRRPARTSGDAASERQQHEREVPEARERGMDAISRPSAQRRRGDTDRAHSGRDGSDPGASVEDLVQGLAERDHTEAERNERDGHRDTRRRAHGGQIADGVVDR